MPGERRREHTGLKINLYHCQSERAGRQDRDVAREEGNGHGGEIKVEEERYKDECG